jgi:hypothetical protein
METKEDLNKDKRIFEEEKRLRKIYKNIPKDVTAIVDGLIQRAAFMRITLEEYEQDLSDKGYVEMFTQSEKTEPYERERPVARLYNSMNTNYQKIIKQLSDLLPKPAKNTTEDDGFDEFVDNK